MPRLLPMQNESAAGGTQAAHSGAVQPPKTEVEATSEAIATYITLSSAELSQKLASSERHVRELNGRILAFNRNDGSRAKKLCKLVEAYTDLKAQHSALVELVQYRPKKELCQSKERTT